ncbi:MAG: hypothetical protein ACM3PP_08125 [Candidatus Saccharibacteria bacterium]
MTNEGCCGTPKESTPIPNPNMNIGGTCCDCSSDACTSMMEAIATTAQMTGFVSPDVRALFDEWASLLTVEIHDWIKGQGQIDPKSIAKQFKISEEASIYFVTRLIRDHKIRVTGVEAV